MPTYRFGDWTVEPHLNRLTSGTGVKQVEPRSMDILVHLLAHAHETVSTESLLDVVWAGRIVEPNAVHRGVKLIRQALGDDPRHPRYIETIRKRGYRAIGEVEEVFSKTSNNDGVVDLKDASHFRWKHRLSWQTAVGVAVLLLLLITGVGVYEASRDSGSRAPERIAVLPLRYLGPRMDLEYLASGLTVEITNRLRAGLIEGESSVVLPEPVVRGKSIAEIGDLAEIITYGTLRIDGEDAVVSVNVLKPASTEFLWSGEVRGPLENPYRLQQQIAGHLARVFSVALQPYEAPSDPQAYSAYLKFIEAAGAYGDHVPAMYWLDQALQLQPEWSNGWANSLAYNIAEFFWFGDAVDLSQAERALERLEMLNAPEATWGQAFIDAYGYGHWERAEPTFRDMATEAPAWYAALMLAAGLHREAEVAALHALQARPYATYQLPLWEVVALARANLQDFPGAVEAYEQIERLLRPDASLYARAVRVLFEGQSAGIANVLEEMSRTAERARPGSITQRKLLSEMQMWRFFWEHSQGRAELARRSADYFAEQNQPATAALMYVMIGDEKSAEAELVMARGRMPHRQLGWYYNTMMLTPEERLHPIIRELEQLMSLTPEWRLELCRRVATLPPSTGFACDPEDYS